MVLKVVCDCCKQVVELADTVQIIDYKGTHWYRCSQCVETFGRDPRSDPYYAGLYYESIMNGGTPFGEPSFNEPKEMIFSKGQKQRLGEKQKNETQG